MLLLPLKFYEFTLFVFSSLSDFAVSSVLLVSLSSSVFSSTGTCVVTVSCFIFIFETVNVAVNTSSLFSEEILKFSILKDKSESSSIAVI